MESRIEKKLKENSIGSSEVLQCSIKLMFDGIGLESTKDSTSTVLLPNKLVTGAVTILNIYVDREGEEPLVLYRNLLPNDLNNPSVISCIGDEGDPLTLRTIFLKLSQGLDELDNAVLQVNKNLKYSFHAFPQFDLKAHSNTMGIAGSSSDFFCTICYADKKHPLQSFPLRDFASSTAIAAKCRWNPHMCDDQYIAAKGVKSIPPAPFLKCTKAVDELHSTVD